MPAPAGSRGRRLRRAVLVLACGLGPSASAAQEGEAPRDEEARVAPRPRTSPWLPRVRLDNDAYNFWIHPGHRTDEQYTNGVVLSFEALRAPGWGRWLGGGAAGCAESVAADGACLSTTVSLGQELYTPNLDRPPFSYPGWESERPYAAWLFVGGEGRRISGRAIRSYWLAVGVTGGPALGELSQSIAHHISRRYTTKATGWDTQVGFEPGLLAAARQTVLALRLAPGGSGVLDAAPWAGVAIGNIRTAADVGGRVRLGMNLSHPWDPRAWRARRPWEWHVSAAGRHEYVARDFSLDGTLLSRAERLVTRVSGVREYEFGTAVRLQRLTLGYRAVTRSREYTTGPSRHTFSQMYSAIEFQP